MSADNADQVAFWGGNAGEKWAAYQGQMDAQLQPVLDGVLDRADLQAGQNVLDVGCGTGASTLQAASMVAPGGHVLGADVSEPMLALAKTRGDGVSNAAFAEADVAVHDFKAGHFDRVISRFGVMFFADSVAAFANIAGAMKPGATLTFASWGQIDRNPYFTVPAQAAKALLGPMPKSDPDAPGPFAFRDIDKVEGILRDAGFADVSGAANDLVLSLPGGASELAQLSCEIGSGARALDYFESDAATAARLQADITEIYAGFPNEAIPAEINYFTATKP
ncbi:class I SAM-dependent methyltransferase [Sulfitobacter sp. TSTF-M16]|uniref:Class I SAM-dependent methyltransferase n=1 Tax=Sulfitobacter aestuariivivens TaxID=2766981 RepID=A0A927HEE6_9RHOB|nr:class I SAM-dependent methyltransferase [Sulfitobacter aestuariivivens]MBD3663308.1 class I SAM-dependent methyltransferase [Sulfitobacter aestuariivivens]